jgi:hypothetical protein
MSQSMMKKTLIAAALCVAANAAFAQAASAPISASKQALINKLVQIQQPGIENLAKSMVQQMLGGMAQAVGQALQQQPAEKREALGKAIQADINKFAEESVATLKDRGQKIAGPTWTPTLDERFTEDELKQIVAWLESPVSKKYQQSTIEMSNNIGPKMFAEAKPTLEPKYHALEQSIAKQLGITPKPAAPASTPAPAAAKPPVKK